VDDAEIAALHRRRMGSTDGVRIRDDPEMAIRVPQRADLRQHEDECEAEARQESVDARGLRRHFKRLP